MIAHAEVQRPAIQACRPVVRTARPCFVTVRTLLASGKHRDYRVVLRPVVVGVVKSGFAEPAGGPAAGFVEPTSSSPTTGGQTLAPGP